MFKAGIGFLPLAYAYQQSFSAPRYARSLSTAWFGFLFPHLVLKLNSLYFQCFELLKNNILCFLQISNLIS